MAGIVKTMKRDDLEQLVLVKIVEAMTAKSDFGELVKKYEKLTSDFTKMKEKSIALQKQLADLSEVTKRIKVMEETKTVRIPKITRSVGLQVHSKLNTDLERKSAVIEIGDEGSKKATVEEMIKKDPLDLLKQSKAKKVDVAKKSTGGKGSKKVKVEDDIKVLEPESSPTDGPITPLTLNVKKSSGIDGIVITWAKKLESFELASIISYELEGSKGIKGEKNLTKLKWSRIGNSIKPLPLPMACNLTNFKTGVLCNFRVKIVTKDNSFYSNISSITL